MTERFPEMDHFDVHRCLGSGGMGTVYDATDRRTSLPAAVKVLHSDLMSPKHRRRFELEARAMQQVSHPNLCAAYDLLMTADGRLALAMERLQGEDLAERLQRVQRLSVREVLTIAGGAARGLRAAHRAGFIHRDIKPSNLFLTHGPLTEASVKVLDFGLAVIQEGPDERLTRTGEVLGTPGYMAPEQVRGERNEDGRTDLFGLASVLYRALSGKAPFEAENALAMIVRMLTEPVVPLATHCPAVPSPLADLIEGCLRVDRAERPASMDEVLRVVQALLPEAATLDAPLALADTAPVRARRVPGGAERRVITALLAEEAPDPEAVMAVIRHEGGRPLDVGSGNIIGLFGAEEWEGDEADRALRAAGRSATLCGLVRVGTGHAADPHGRDLSDVMRTMVGATRVFSPGVQVDEQTRRALQESDGVSLSGTVPEAFPFVGREPELSELEARFARACEDCEGGGVLLLGAAGIGKTRVVEEFSAAIQSSGQAVEVFQGYGSYERRFSPWYAWSRALRAFADAPEELNATECVERFVACAAALELTETTAWFLAAASGVELPENVPELVVNARRAPRRMREQIVMAVGDLLEALSLRASVVLVLEDVHWADTASLELVDVLLCRLESSPFFVLMTGRHHATEERKELFEHPHLHHRPLHELSRKAGCQLASSAAAAWSLQLREPIVQEISEHAGGNPFFILEVLGHIGDRMQRFGRDGFDPTAFVLPLTVEAAVQSRLDHLPTEDKELLKCAAVYGEHFWLEGLEQVHVAHSIRRLRRQRLVRRPALRDRRLREQDEYAFRHRVVREVAYGMLTEDQRRAMHRHSAAWLATVPAARPEEIGQHYRQAGRFEEAAPWWLEAASRAVVEGDPQAVLRRLEQALSGLSEGSERADVLLRKMRAAVECGDYQVAADAQSDLGDRPAWSAGTQRAEWLYLGARLLRVRSRGADSNAAYHDAIPLLEESAVLYEQAGDRSGHVRVLATMATTLQYLDESMAREVAARSVSVASDDPALEGRAYSALATVLMHRGAFSEAEVAASRAVAAAEVSGDLGGAVTALGDLAYIHQQLGSYAAAVDALREVILRAQRIGQQRSAGYAWHNLGLALLRTGAGKEALAAEERALQMARNAGNTLLATYCELYRTMILCELDQIEDAMLAANNAMDGCRGRVEESAARVVRAMVHRAAGEPQKALRDAAQARALRDAAGTMLEFEGELLCLQAELLLESNRFAEASDVVREAQAWLRERADRVALSGEERTRFLSMVPSHARIVSLGERLPS